MCSCNCVRSRCKHFVVSHFTVLNAAFRFGWFGRGGKEQRREERGAADDSLPPDRLSQKHKAKDGRPKWLGGIQCLGPGRTDGLLSAHLQKGCHGIDGQSRPQRQQGDGAAVLPRGSGEVVGCLAASHRRHQQDRQDGLGEDFARNELPGLDDLAIFEQPQIVRGVEARRHDAQGIAEGQVAVGGGVGGGTARARRWVAGEEEHPTQSQRNGRLDSIRDRHAHDALHHGHDEGRQLDEEGPVVGRRRTQSVQVGGGAQHLPQAQFQPGLRLEGQFGQVQQWHVLVVVHVPATSSTSIAFIDIGITATRIRIATIPLPAVLHQRPGKRSRRLEERAADDQTAERHDADHGIEQKHRGRGMTMTTTTTNATGVGQRGVEGRRHGREEEGDEADGQQSPAVFGVGPLRGDGTALQLLQLLVLAAVVGGAGGFCQLAAAAAVGIPRQIQSLRPIREKEERAAASAAASGQFPASTPGGITIGIDVIVVVVIGTSCAAIIVLGSYFAFERRWTQTTRRSMLVLLRFQSSESFYKGVCN